VWVVQPPRSDAAVELWFARADGNTDRDTLPDTDAEGDCHGEGNRNAKADGFSDADSVPESNRLANGDAETDCDTNGRGDSRLGIVSGLAASTPCLE